MKESVIGVEVFDREPGYDPKAEPIVRTEARRLRQKLESFYDTDSGAPPCRILLPKGGYVPAFELMSMAEPPHAPKPRWWIGAVVIGLALFGVLLLARRQSSPAPYQIQVLTTLPGLEEGPALSPDATHVIFSWRGEGQDNLDLYVAAADGAGTPRRLTTHPGPDEEAKWSPDGKRICWIRDRMTVMVADADGRNERALTRASYHSVSWTADSRSIVVPRHPVAGKPFHLAELPLDGGPGKVLTTPPDDSTGDLFNAVSRSGRLAYVRYRNDGCELSVESRAILFEKADIHGIAWSADEQDIFFNSSRRGYREIWSIPANGGDVRLVLASTDDLGSPAAGPDGAIVYSRRRFDTNIYRLAPLSTSPKRTVASTRTDSSPRLSPDGKRLAFISDRGGFPEIWLADFDGTNARRIADLKNRPAGSPQWSPDSKSIAFDLQESRQRAIFTADVQTGAVRRISAWGRHGRPTWSADGRWIYFYIGAVGSYEIWKIPATAADGSTPAAQVTHGGGYEGMESPDGKVFYFLRSPQQWDLWSIPTSGASAPTRVIEGGVHHGWWRPTTNGICWIPILEDGMLGQNADTPKKVLAWDAVTRRTRTIAELRTALFKDTPDFFIAPDESALWFSAIDSNNSDIEVIRKLH